MRGCAHLRLVIAAWSRAKPFDSATSTALAEGGAAPSFILKYFWIFLFALRLPPPPPPPPPTSGARLDLSSRSRSRSSRRVRARGRPSAEGKWKPSAPRRRRAARAPLYVR